MAATGAIAVAGIVGEDVAEVFAQGCGHVMRRACGHVGGQEAFKIVVIAHRDCWYYTWNRRTWIPAITQELNTSHKARRAAREDRCTL
jgi:hypothetical protein